jgi:DNA-binding MarR family transcriptional regulator
MDPSLPVDLSAAERVALAALLRRVEAYGGRAAFWVRRCNLGEVLGRVERTVTNWLNALEAKGLITKEQGRTRWGNFSCVTLHLTAAASDLFGLSEDSTSQASSRLRKNSSPGFKEALTKDKEQSLQRHPNSVDTLEIPKTEMPNARDVPADCAPLLHCGLREPAIFKLMGLAGRKGKRLGEIITARFEAIQAARNPYALLCSLVSDAVDYSAVVASETARTTRQKEADEAAAATAAMRQRLSDAWVHVRDDLYVFTRSGSVPEVYRPAEGGKWRYSHALAGRACHEFWARCVDSDWMPSPPPAVVL